MRGYLIDTNVISEYNREQSPHTGVVKWLDTTSEASQYVSVLTLAEIERGILRKEEGKRRRELQRWFDLRTERKAMLKSPELVQKMKEQRKQQQTARRENKGPEHDHTGGRKC